jgi:glutamate dehydrogenase/leucine dehydrogenase
MTGNMRLWLVRLLVGAVFLVNVQCATLFLFWPANYAPAFELSGVVGEATLRGIGVLFLMWNVPYAIACFDPYKYRLSHYEAIAMQAIGVVGESLILWRLPAGHTVLAASLSRFIAFDAAGLAVLALAAWIACPALVTRGSVTGG